MPKVSRVSARYMKLKAFIVCTTPSIAAICCAVKPLTVVRLVRMAFPDLICWYSLSQASLKKKFPGVTGVKPPGMLTSTGAALTK
jgi:hypothetical protein